MGYHLHALNVGYQEIQGRLYHPLIGHRNEKLFIAGECYFREVEGQLKGKNLLVKQVEQKQQGIQKRKIQHSNMEVNSAVSV